MEERFQVRVDSFTAIGLGTDGHLSVAYQHFGQNGRATARCIHSNSIENGRLADAVFSVSSVTRPNRAMLSDAIPRNPVIDRSGRCRRSSWLIASVPSFEGVC